ncbi:LLM class flavin-dependent oxidoreductase [Actinomadura oligospora]|uniref:LLM class flavin-dependent oxidoreductase n=1 Tax=Actinomadura oligospora TaxID=111804 RepID=UPI00047C68B9|nr:LLM class flavin-dependent oxidoreductase [Actinomadura oligospora]
MRSSINIPNFGDFADARAVATVAVAAEQAGWDALFVWDHLTHDQRTAPFGDPWMLLTAAALATSRIRLGTMVTPVARRRPQQLARQVATLDVLSGGRVTLGVGLGDRDDFSSFGEPTDQRVLAEHLDEGLELLEQYWTGEPVTFRGRHYQAENVALRPAPVQRPHPPIWVAGFWPRRPPMRRAARFDGAIPLFTSASHGDAPPAHEVRDLVAYVREQREALPDGQGGRPFEIVVGGVSPTDRDQAADLLGPLAEAGATWWDERQRMDGDDLDRLSPVLTRIEQGPPSF